MNVRWKTLLAKTTFWLAAEIVLGIMGLDNLADYGEYHFSPSRMLTLQALVTLV